MGDYGFHKLPDNNDEIVLLMRKYFHEFVETQKLANRFTGCGSYLFDGQTSFDYYPAQYPKQKLLFDYSKGKKNILEIGVYAGHSCWLMLMANLDNPDFHYTGIDICYCDFTEPCIQYLQKQYPGRITFINSDSLSALTTLDLTKFDLIHIDGAHTSDVVVAEASYILNHINPGTLLVFDDFDHDGPRSAFQYFGYQMNILDIPQCPYRNCIATKK